MKRTAITRHTKSHGHLTVQHLTGHVIVPSGGRHRAPSSTGRWLVAVAATAAVMAPTTAAQAAPVPEPTDVAVCAPGTHLVGATCFTNGTVKTLIDALHIAAGRVTR